MSISQQLRQTTKHWTEGRVFDQLRHVFPSPAYTRLPQVRNGTGFARSKTRTADAIVLSTWPSRGVWMAGVEIKVSVADWKKELANPAKAGEIQAYCHHWYVACPKGLIDVAHIPTNWGLIEVTGTTAAITREAPRLDTKPVDLLLVCAILRAVESCTVPKESVEDQICERVKKAIDGEQQRVQYEFDALKESVKAFREASGVDIGMRWDAGRIGAAVAFVQKVGIAGARDQAERLAKECDRAATALRGAITKLDAGVVESDDDDD